MYLFFDTETTGLPNYKADLTDPSQPHIVQLACVLTDEQGREMSSYKVPIDLPEGVSVDEAGRAFEVNKVSNDMLERYGVSMIHALGMFRSFEQRATLKIAYNYRFDGFLLRCAHARAGVPALQPSIGKYDPLVIVRQWKAQGMLPSAKLVDAYTFVTGKPPLDAHDAMGDVRMMMDVFFHIKKQGQFKDEN